MNFCFRLARQTFPRAPPNTLRHSYRPFTSSRILRFSRIAPKQLPNRTQWSRRLYCLGLGGTVTLSLAVPIAASTDESDDKITAEKRLLQHSDQERREAHTVPEHLPIVLKLWRKSCRVVVDWIIEPVATGFRFITLLCIFTPVMLAIPLVYIGPRISNKSGERKGTIWWYQFLVKSLERAGPTFIKVEPNIL
jgi:aarF domain-containing kinase